MTLTRRRFLMIAAAFATTPAIGQTHRWRGQALGADVAITLNGPEEVVQPALQDAQATIRTVEELFSLYDPNSALTQLNQSGYLDMPPALFVSLMQNADLMHAATEGLFDPTVQPLWRALAEGRETAQALSLVGWHRVRHSAERIALGSGQSLTFNGIAQGFATDLVADMLAGHGLTNALVNIGEYRGQGGPWRLGLSDPEHGFLGTRTLSAGAIATSSPGAMALGDGGHILHGSAKPKWSTVSVRADSATIADAASTALVLADRSMVTGLVGQHGIHQITLVDRDGNLTTHSKA